MSLASTASRLKDARAELAALEDRIASAEQQASALKASLSSTLRAIDATRRRIENAGAQLTDLQSQESVVQDSVDADQAQLDTRAAEAYEDPLGSIDVVLGASSIQDLQSRLDAGTLQILPGEPGVLDDVR